MQKTKLKFSPGMMQSGLSRELFESWGTDKKSGVLHSIHSWILCRGNVS